MKNHNVQFMDVRLSIGSLFDIVNQKKTFLTVENELDILENYIVNNNMKLKDYISIILSINKNNKNIIDNI